MLLAWGGWDDGGGCVWPALGCVPSALGVLVVMFACCWTGLFHGELFFFFELDPFVIASKTDFLFLEDLFSLGEAPWSGFSGAGSPSGVKKTTSSPLSDSSRIRPTLPLDSMAHCYCRFHPYRKN